MSSISSSEVTTSGNGNITYCDTYTGNRNSTDTDGGYVGYLFTINATGLKSITVPTLQRIMYSGNSSSCDAVSALNEYSRCSTNTTSSVQQYKTVCVTISTNRWLYQKTGILETYSVDIYNQTDYPISSQTYTFSTPYTGTLYVVYSIPTFVYTYKSYAMQAVVKPSNSGFTLTDADTSLSISATINDVEEYGTDNIEYINLEDTSDTISGKYTVTSDYPNSLSYLNIGSTKKETSLVYNTETTFSYGSISPTLWSSPTSITLYAKNTKDGYSSFTKSVRLYSAPVGNDHSGETPVYKKGSSNTIRYLAFTNYGLNQIGLSVSCSKGTATINTTYSSDGDVYIDYTPDTSSCGSFTGNNSPVITLTDAFTGSSYTATSKFPYIVYAPPVASFTPTTYTPTYGEEVTFTNNSTEDSSCTYKYYWSLDGVSQSSYSAKSNYTYTFSNFNQHTIKLTGVCTDNYGDSSSVSHTYAVPSYVPDVVFNSIGSVYVTVPATASIVVDPTKEGITYTWYFKAHTYDTYTKVQDGGSSYTFTPTVTTDSGSYIKVTAEKNGEMKYAELSFLVHEPTPTISFKCYSDAAGTTEITSSTPIADSSTKVYLQNNSTAVSGTSPTYKWYFNGSEVTPISTLNTDLPYFIPSVSSTGQFTLELKGTVGSYVSSSSKSLTIVSPAPSISIVTSQSSAQYGDTISCSLNMVETVVGVSYNYSWTLNGSQVSTSSTMSFTVDTKNIITYLITAVVSVVGSRTTWTSNTATATVNTLDSKDPVSRFTVVITNGTKYMVCTRNTMSPCRYNNLSFEKRLNETGSGSFDLLVNSSDDSDVLASGSDIIIYDNQYPLYYGVITSINNNEINPYNITLSKKYYSIEFSEGCRLLSYIQCSNNEIVSESTISTIVGKILDSKYIGAIDDYSGKYSFSVSSQDELSQIDSFGEQCGARYRTNIKTYCNVNDAKYYSTNYVYKSGGWGVEIPVNAIVFCRNSNCIVLAKMRAAYTSTTYAYLETTEICKFGSVSVNDSLQVSVILNNPIIDFKRTYYQTNSVIMPNNGYNALVVNKNTYDVDDIDNLNKHYGSISCTSPQMKGVNITRTIDLNSPIDEDYKLTNYAYVTNSIDTKVIDCYKNGNYWVIVIDGTYTNVTGNNLYYPYWDGDKYIYGRLGASTSGASSAWVSSTYSKNGISCPCTNVQTTMTLLPGEWSESSIVGMPLINSIVTADGSGLLTSSAAGTICIGGTVFKYSSISLINTTYTITLDLTSSSSWGTSYLLNIPNGTLILDNYTWGGSPKSLYSNRTLSVILQNNMDYGEVGLLASNIARYGSNFTSNITGTCSIKDFITSDWIFPMVGDHVAIYYDDGSENTSKKSINTVADIGDKEYDNDLPAPNYDNYCHDFELQSFTVNTQTMTVEYNMGMKPLNIGDIIYRISQNMTTNITTN